MAKRIVVEFAGETRSLDKAFASIQQSSAGISRTFKGLAASAAFGVVTNQFGDMVKAASDLNEAMNKSAVVFGNQAGQVEIWAGRAADSFGLSKQEAIEAAATFGNMFDAMGIGQRASVDMSQSVVELASDLASFNNIPIPDVLDRLRSGLLGEQEAVERLGINMSETRLKAKALEMGMGDGKKVLDANAKAQAAYAIILEDTGNAQGDFARTSDSLANQQRRLSAQMKDVSARIGSDLVPAMSMAADFAMDTLIPNFEGFLGLGSEFDTFGAHFRDAIGDMVGFLLGAIQQGARGIANLFSALPTDFGQSIADDLREAADNMDVYRDALHATGEELFGVKNREDALQKSIDATIDAVLGETDAKTKQAGATKKTAQEIEKEADARIKLRDVQLDLAQADYAVTIADHELARARDEYNKFLETGGIDLEKVKQLQDELVDSQNRAEKATLDVADAQAALNKALEPATEAEWLEAGDDAARAQNDLTLAQLDHTEAADEYAKLVVTGKASQEELTRAWIEADNAARNVHDKERALLEAQGGLNDLTKKGTTDSQAYKDALGVLTDKLGVLKTATDNWKLAQDAVNTAQGQGKDYTEKLWGFTDNLTKAEMDLEAKQWAAEKAALAQKDALGATNESVRAVWGNVIGYNEELGKIPRDVKTTITYEELYTIPTGASDPKAAAYAQYLKETRAKSPNADPLTYDMWENMSWGGKKFGGGRAGGGRVTTGMAYMVGEAGPEMFVPGRSGTIVPNGGGGVSIVVNGWVGDEVSLTRKIVDALATERRMSGALGLG